MIPACKYRRISRRTALSAIALSKPVHENVVIDPIKEFLQIDIDYYPVAFLRITLCLKHRIVRTPARTETITAFGERRINQWLKNLQ